MNKTAIKNFAIWARRKLINEITYKAGLIGVSEKGILQPLSTSTDNIQFFDIGTGKPTEIVDAEIKQREALIKHIKEKEANSDYKTAFQFVIEEVAYTWFNRLIAIRFMEVNDYLPSGIRVLSSETIGKIEPDMVTTPFDTDMEFTFYETESIIQLKDENKLDELFRILFIKQCNKLNGILPELFKKTDDFAELLLTITFTDSDGIVSHLITDIPENDFTSDVEIMGWLYQYYNTELNELVYDGNMSKSRISKELLPAATTIYTPDWAIRYMVENSLGKLWLEGHPNDSLKVKWKYYLEKVEQENSVQAQLDKLAEEYKQLTPSDIKIIDPCMGSGHILLYAFEVLMQIYESEGYTQRDAAIAIIENNLYGLDIDDRAYQLAYFAIMMKARKYDRKFLNRGVFPKLYSILESNDFNKNHLQFFGRSLYESERKLAIQQLEALVNNFNDAKEYGSILNIGNFNWKLLNRLVDDLQIEGQMSIESIGIEETQFNIKTLLEQGEIMEKKYNLVITNPPYFSSARFSPKLDKYAKENYADVKSDLSMMMYKRAINSMCANNGFVSFITTSSWMFVSSFEKLRSFVLEKYSFDSIVDFGTELFDGKVGHNPIIAWVNRKTNINNKIIAVRLVDYCYSRRNEKENEYFNKQNYYFSSKEDLFKIPGTPIAYWVSDTLSNAFMGKSIKDYGYAGIGMRTGDNNRFLRFWNEVDFNRLHLNCGSREEQIESKRIWIPYNKGGEFRKWYGNNYYVVNWYNDGYEIKENTKKVYPQLGNNLGWKISNENYYYKPGITWSGVTSGSFSCRCYEEGFIFDSGANGLFSYDNEDRYYLAGLLNTNLGNYILKILNPTINTGSGTLKNVPVIMVEDRKSDIHKIVKQNIEISKKDWDSFENSWDFKMHPLLNGSDMNNAFNNWKEDCDERFKMLKSNEENLNRIFIEIYGLENELKPEIEEKDVTVRKADLMRDVKSFVSYAVGCMFGRYSLDVQGLAYGGGEWNASKYSTFIPDEDNCIPIMDEEYFEDDIVGRFVEFVKVVYGEEALEENLDFIAQILGNKGSTSREILRNYFIKDFYKDHVKVYQKRPIYWLYDSGKQNGFKALVYMHRYTADTTGVVRVDYLHKMQKIYMSEIDRMTDMVENSNNSREVAQAEKRKEKLIKQLKETKEYDEKVAHLALSRISIDLDDGVKVNYEKVQTGQDGKEITILGKI